MTDKRDPFHEPTDDEVAALDTPDELLDEDEVAALDHLDALDAQLDGDESDMLLLDADESDDDGNDA